MKDAIETDRGYLVKSKSKKPDMIVRLKEGYSTIWTIRVKHITCGIIWYKSYEVSSSHSEEEAIQTYIKNHTGGRYDFATKENHPEFFV